MIWPVTQDMEKGDTAYVKGDKPISVQSFVIGDIPMRDAKGQVETANARLMSTQDLGRSGFFLDDSDNVVYSINGRHGSPVSMWEYMLKEIDRGVSC